MRSCDMSKAEVSEESKLGIQDHLYRLFVDLKPAQRDKVLSDARAQRVSIGDIADFVQKARKSNRLADPKKIEGIVESAAGQALGSAGKESEHQAIMEYVHSVLS